MNNIINLCKIYEHKLCKIKYIMASKQGAVQDDGKQIDGTNLERVNKLNYLEIVINNKWERSYRQNSKNMINCCKNEADYMQARPKHRHPVLKFCRLIGGFKVQVD